MTVRPSWRARGLKRLHNQLKHRGVIVDLNDTEATIARLRKYIADCDELIEAERFIVDKDGLKHARHLADGNVIAKHMANQRPAIQALHLALETRDGTKPPADATAENVIPRLLRALDAFPEARSAVLAALGGDEESGEALADS